MTLDLTWDDDLEHYEWVGDIAGPAGSCSIDLLDEHGHEVASAAFDYLAPGRLVGLRVYSAAPEQLAGWFEEVEPADEAVLRVMSGSLLEDPSWWHAARLCDDIWGLSKDRFGTERRYVAAVELLEVVLRAKDPTLAYRSIAKVLAVGFDGFDGFDRAASVLPAREFNDLAMRFRSAATAYLGSHDAAPTLVAILQRLVDEVRPIASGGPRVDESARPYPRAMSAVAHVPAQAGAIDWASGLVDTSLGDATITFENGILTALIDDAPPGRYWVWARRRSTAVGVAIAGEEDLAVGLRIVCIGGEMPESIEIEEENPYAVALLKDTGRSALDVLLIARNKARKRDWKSAGEDYLAVEAFARAAACFTLAARSDKVARTDDPAELLRQAELWSQLATATYDVPEELPPRSIWEKVR